MPPGHCVSLGSHKPIPFWIADSLRHTLFGAYWRHFTKDIDDEGYDTGSQADDCEEGGDGDSDGFFVDDGADGSPTVSELTDEPEAQFTDDESDDGDPESVQGRARRATGISVELAHTQLNVHDDLEDHPIHGPRNGRQTRDRFTKVPNYVHPFIRAKEAPEHVWPHNAADWGFIEYLPSQTDMTPRKKGRPHPALGHDGNENMVYARVNAAFYYKLPGGGRKHSEAESRRSCRITNWSIDPDTEKAILDDCWGCRRVGEVCTLRGEEYPRMFRNGEPIEGHDPNDYPPFDSPRVPSKQWTPAVKLARSKSEKVPTSPSLNRLANAEESKRATNKRRSPRQHERDTDDHDEKPDVGPQDESGDTQAPRGPSKPSRRDMSKSPEIKPLFNQNRHLPSSKKTQLKPSTTPNAPAAPNAAELFPDSEEDDSEIEVVVTVRPSRRQSTVAEGGPPGSATAPLLADLTESDNEDENDNVVRI